MCGCACACAYKCVRACVGRCTWMGGCASPCSDRDRSSRSIIMICDRVCGWVGGWVGVWVCVDMYVWVWVCIYVRVCVWMCKCVRVSVYGWGVRGCVAVCVDVTVTVCGCGFMCVDGCVWEGLGVRLNPSPSTRHVGLVSWPSITHTRTHT